MVRHLVREVVKHGHWKEFIAASKAWNEAATKAGLPAYRIYASNWGTFNEAFAEAEYESSGDIEARFAAAQHGFPDLNEAYGALLSHLVDGEAHDYVLSEESLD
jgi:hypothetical protein